MRSRKTPPPPRRRSTPPSIRRPHRRRGPPDRERQDVLTGTISLEADGSGRLLPDRPGLPSVPIPPEDAAGFADGEAVTVRLEIGRKGRVRGRILARGLTRFDELVGIVHKSGAAVLLLPQPEGPPFLLAAGDLHGAVEGDAVAARVLDLGRGARVGRAAVTEVLGRPGEPQVQVEMLIRSLGLPRRFPEAALAQAAGIPAPHPASALADHREARRDLRSIPHVTIDGEDARDFDDAVAARPEAGGVRVWVSIADVSAYVPAGSPLDEAARERGTSAYFPDRVLPMLPERLSTDLCSLVPNAPRATLTCEMRVRSNGRIEDVRLYPSLIESAGRLTYDQVQAAIDGRGGPAADHLLLPHLVAASRALRARRRTRGGLDLDLPEAQVLLGPDGEAAHIRERPRLEAHRVIEDLMIAANEAVAEHLLARGWPAVYRVHAEPDPRRLAALAAWARPLGLTFDVKGAREPKVLARFAAALARTPQAVPGTMVLLRSLAQAHYSTENLGHYGLASRAYLHFTSPIRRYPDLLVHRSLRALWRGEAPPAGLEADAARSSLQERRAADAERAVAALMSCHVAERHLGEIFDAVVTGVHTAGAFVRVREPWLEGLVPMAALGGGDYYDVLEREQALVARRSGDRLALGDTLTVRLVSVSTYRRQISFERVRSAVRLSPQSRPRPATLPPRSRSASTHRSRGRSSGRSGRSDPRLRKR